MSLKRLIDIGALSRFKDNLLELIPSRYASSQTAGGVADKAASIPFGKLDGTSTATVMTATVPGITELRDGVCMWLKNGVVTSASGFTLNINGLGAKPVYGSLAAATRSTTVFGAAYTMLFIYNSTRVDGGCWDCVYGYDSNTNTIGYQIRTNSGTRPVSDQTGRYRLLFSSADNMMWVPANTASTTNATSARAVNQRPINPFGPIVYYSHTTVYAAGTNVGTSYQWSQYALTLGYSFNRTGAALVLTYPAPVYIKCAPQSDGSAIIDADTPYVQSLPSTEDGKIYIYLGIAASATTVELIGDHPVYCYRNGAIRVWTGIDRDIPEPSDDTPFSIVNSSGASPGISTKYARADHEHAFDGNVLESISAENIPVILYDDNNYGVYIPHTPFILSTVYASQLKMNFALVVPPNYNSYPVLFTPSKFDTTTGELHLTGIVGGVLYEATLLPGADPIGNNGIVMVGTMTTTNLALPAWQGGNY